jgi:hypothetical protein
MIPCVVEFGNIDFAVASSMNSWNWSIDRQVNRPAKPFKGGEKVQFYEEVLLLRGGQ